MGRKIAILSTEVDEPTDGVPRPFSRNENNFSFAHFIESANQLGLWICIANFHEYRKGTVFSCWTYKNNVWRKQGKIRVDEIWDRASLKTEERQQLLKDIKDVGIEVFNHPELMICFQDKKKNFELAPEHLIPTEEVGLSLEANIQKIEKIRGSKLHPDFDPDTIILKPRFGYEGHGIIRIKGKNYDPLVKIKNQPYIIQPFLETSHGIPELGIEGRCDLRVIIIDGKPLMAYSRIAKKGRFISGTYHGAQIKSVEIAKIPGGFMEVVKIIDEKIKHFQPRIYSTDMGVGKKKIWVFENNGYPTIVWNPNQKEDIERKKMFQKSILSAFLQNASNKGALASTIGNSPLPEKSDSV